MTTLFSCLLAAGAAIAAQAQAPTTQARPTATPAQTPARAGQAAPAQPRPAAPAAPGATTGTRPAAPATQGQPPATGAPAAPVAPRRTAPVSVRGGLAITVTDPTGATLPGVHVAVVGLTDRAANTNDSGQVNLPGLLAGNYRLRFTGDNVITYEREVALRAGQILAVDVALNPAPKPPPPPPPPPAPVVAPPQPRAVTGPVGQPQSVSIVDLIEKDFVGRQPRRESLLSCSGNTRTTMLQINEPLPPRVYEAADVAYYVLGGEGTLKLNGRDTRIATNAYLSVPRGMSHSFERRGNRPLILLAVLGGEPCETAK